MFYSNIPCHVLFLTSIYEGPKYLYMDPAKNLFLNLVVRGGDGCGYHIVVLWQVALIGL